MIAEDSFPSPSRDDEGGVYTTFSQSRFISRIGDDLRGFYGDVASGAQPDHLMELASRIDDRRRSELREG